MPSSSKKEHDGGMNDYTVARIWDGKKQYYCVRNPKLELMEVPTQYLVYKIRTRCSPYSVKRMAYAISYYLAYCDETGVTIEAVVQFKYDKQHVHFTNFLSWLQAGNHIRTKRKHQTGNATCNEYLKAVFGWYEYQNLQGELPELKVLIMRSISVYNAVGVKMTRSGKHFRGFLPEDPSYGKTADANEIVALLQNCTNLRDKLMLLLLAETGFRIGELLGVRYLEDIDYDNQTIRVVFREDNENLVRAKNAENRRAKMSNETFSVLLCYLSEYRSLLKKGRYLFVTLSGDHAGNPLRVSTVYGTFRYLEKKTGLHVSPHMLRHYFANARRKAGWDLLLISKALGHRDLSATQRYLDLATEELIEATDAYYKENGSLYPLEELL